MKPLRITVTSAFGVEGLLRREMNRLGYVEHLAVGKGGVTFDGDWLDLARCNLMIRQGERVMAEVGSFPAADFDALFEGTKALPWEDWLGRDAAFPVTGKSVKSALFSVPDCQAIIKKAIVERLKRRWPQTDWLPETGPLYQVMFKITQDQVTVGLNSSGDGLHKRGWRKLGSQAPLKETLAAVVLTLSNWRPELPLTDPFCGSGTILIEAVRKALGMAPGLDRNFAAEAWPQMPADCWRQAREEARGAVRDMPDLRVEGYDIDPEVLSMARYHAKLAGVERYIHFQRRDIRDFRSAKKYGAVITNPAYGQRLGGAGEAAQLYKTMGQALAPLDTWSFYVLTAYPAFEEAFGRPATKNTKLFNGNLECRLYQYHGPRPS
ncbi:MAG: class I SAM-dependent RNA methyltransferase [Peptococcaceae bacterium]|jgi:putative N6-adenine-specific DNA methylase|nr:class I SAM-dependent RNA methyltransferase [Peptococcaceae bacterium]